MIECAAMRAARAQTTKSLAALFISIAVAGCGSTRVVTTTITQTRVESSPTKPADVLVSPSIAVQAPAVREPKEFEFSADGSEFARISSWSSWTSTEATASATMELNNCNPNCAQGTFTSYPGLLLLSDPQPCARATPTEFERVVFIPNPGEAYPRDASRSWPLSCVPAASRGAAG